MSEQLHGPLAETPDGDIHDYGDHPDHPDNSVAARKCWHRWVAATCGCATCDLCGAHRSCSTWRGRHA